MFGLPISSIKAVALFYFICVDIACALPQQRLLLLKWCNPQSSVNLAVASQAPISSSAIPRCAWPCIHPVPVASLFPEPHHVLVHASTVHTLAPVPSPVPVPFILLPLSAIP